MVRAVTEITAVETRRDVRSRTLRGAMFGKTPSSVDLSL